MSPEARVQQTVARIRALVRQLTAPDPALLRLAADADAHVAALQPKLTVLDPATFGALASVQPDAHEPRRTHVPARRGRNTAADRDLRRSAGPRQSYSPVPAVRAPGNSVRGRAWEQLPPRTERADSDNATNTSERARRSRPALPLAVADRAPDMRQRRGKQARTTDSTSAVQSHTTAIQHAPDAAPVDVGRLADRIRARAAEHAAAARETEPVLPASASRPAPGRGDAPAHHEAARTALPLSAVRVQDARAEPSSSAARNDARTPSVVGMPVGASTAAPVAGDTGEAPRHAGAAQRFLFDPFATAQVAAPSDDALAARVEALLREQARRHGVDLS